MQARRPIFAVLGPIIGFILLYFVLNSAVGHLQQGQAAIKAGEEAAATATAQAAAPAVAAAAGVTDATAAQGVTATGGVSITLELTTTEPVTGAGVITAAAPVTATQPVTSTETVTSSQPVTAAQPATASQPVTSSQPVTTTGTVTATTAVAATTVVTATEPASATESATPEAVAAPVAAAQPVAAPEEVVAAITRGGCIACHVMPGVPGAVGIVGPSLANIGADAATRVPGLSAEEYIHESIVNPNAFTAPQCPFGPCIPGQMPANINTLLDEQAINGIVQYLLTLRSGS